MNIETALLAITAAAFLLAAAVVSVPSSPPNSGEAPIFKSPGR